MSYRNKLEYFINTLSMSNKTPNYFINWEKVVKNTNEFELELNTLNYLIGKEDIINETKKLFKNQPNLIKAIPSLIAERNKEIVILDLKEFVMSYKKLNFKNIDEDNTDLYVDFCENIGLLDFIKNHTNKSLVDYVYGVEAGLDSNGRKNRSGTNMETIVEDYVSSIAQEHNLEYLPQAKASQILSKWGKDVPTDKANRSFDLAIYNKSNDKLFLLETNYYNGGGSKLKSVCGEFMNLNRLIGEDKNISFIWVTDGQGWKTALNPITEAMAEINNILNLHMIFSDGLLKEILSK
ncbi:type II restriction endonuclease [Helcococcus kunzii]|uniref:type II restriction endonuclease n=1 Tax=Helcococcus kunzii TaxID=40091 RepID=UPI0021A54796|nr:type II restriction endonuclease [Helcococcus kunzii]MCT1796973.1 type II restriction endonuclease [Helcococcus kunzii]MCT1988470.1 type II restriction endonuclease [Helcococcus kunzii]